MSFLTSDFFAALSETFGRPEVFLLLTKAKDLPFEIGDAVVLDWKAGTGDAVVSALDPRSGTTLRLDGAGLSGRRFEVMYHARG